MAGSEYYDHTTYPATSASGSSAAMRAELDAIEAGFGKLPSLVGNGTKFVRVNAGETALEAVSGGFESSTNKDASGGYAGLTLFKLNMRNVANTFTSWFTNTNTAARTYTLPDKDGTVAMTSDITGTNSGTNTGDNAVNSLYSGLAASKQDVSAKDATGGYAGLTLFKINFKNAANTFTNFFTNATTAARTYTFPDKDGTVAMTSDITGTNSGTNTGDSAVNSLYSGLDAAKQNVSAKDATGGYVGMTLFKINFKNAANTFTNFFTNATTAARTYTFPDKDITVAGLVDITGTNSGTNTGDNATNTQYASDYRAANFVAGTNYIAPGGALGTPASGTLTNCSFPTLNQNTSGSSGSCTGNAVTATTAANGLGTGWTDVSASRALATNYTNSTGKPMIVYIDQTTNSVGWGYDMLQGGTITVRATESTATNALISGMIIVPPGSTYRVNGTGSASSFNKWWEFS